MVWSSSDDNVATVDNGLVTLVAEGTCVITATAETEAGLLSATCDVEVLRRNLTPFFSEPGTSDYWLQYRYTETDRKTYIEPDSDGWVSFVNDPTQGSSSLFMDVRVAAQEFVEADTEYTLLVESQGEFDAVQVISLTGAANQLKPGSSNLTVDLTSGVNTYITLNPGDLAAERLLSVQLKTSSNEPYTGKIRLSLYKGSYSGGYTPYVDV